LTQIVHVGHQIPLGSHMIGHHGVVVANRIRHSVFLVVTAAELPPETDAAQVVWQLSGNQQVLLATVRVGLVDGGRRSDVVSRHG
jgi:hypothetical protein